MDKLWVVECKYSSGNWGICDFTSYRYVSSRFHFAHTLKRQIQAYLFYNGSKSWTKDKFRVREYKRS